MPISPPLALAASAREAAQVAALLRSMPRAGKESWLLNSALLNYATLVRLLLADGMSPSTINAEQGNVTPLHAAAEHGALDVLRLLLEAGADANSCNCVGNTPLDEAVGHGQLTCARENSFRTRTCCFSTSLATTCCMAASSATSQSASSCCCPTLRTTSTYAPSRDAPRVIRRTPLRHYFSRVIVVITPW